MENENKTDFSLFTIENILSGTTDIPPVDDTEDDDVAATTDDVDTSSDSVDNATDDTDTDTVTSTDDTDDLDSNDDSSDLKPFYEALNKELGVNEFDYDKVDEGIPGLMGYLKDVVTSSVESELENIKEMGNGLVGNLYEYLRNGGKPEEFVKTFLETPDMSKLDLADESNQKAVLKAYLESQDFDKDEIDDKLESYDAAGILEKEAKSAQRKLEKIETARKEQFLAAQQQAAEQRKAQVDAYWNDIKETIDKADTIGGFPIDDKDRDAFFNYMAKPGKDGLTELQKLYNDKEQSLKLAYAAFKNFKFENVVKKAKTEAVKDVKKAITRFTDTNAKPKGSQYDVKTNKTNFKDFVLPIH